LRNGIEHIGHKRWEVFYGYGEEDGVGYQYRVVVTHRPSLDEVKAMVLSRINQNVQERILSGMRYRGRMVWLSAENQRNIAMGYALAKGGDLEELPTVKLGTDDDFELYTFEDVEELVGFAKAVQEHIEDSLYEGRAEKDSVDWSAYSVVKEPE
jgi:hypothetical protein